MRHSDSLRRKSQLTKRDPVWAYAARSRHVVVVEETIGAARKDSCVASAGPRQPRLFADCPRTIDCTSWARDDVDEDQEAERTRGSV